MTVAAERMTLRQLVAIELEAAPADDPHDIGARIAEALPDHHLRAALAECVPLMVKQLQARETARLAGLGQGRRPRSLVDSESAPLELLTRSFCIKPGTWKELRNCRMKDLRRMAGYRGFLARTNSRWQQRLEHLADALNESGEHLVRDLAPDVVRSIFEPHAERRSA